MRKQFFLIILMLFPACCDAISDLQEHPFVTFTEQLYKKKLNTIKTWQIPNHDADISCNNVLPEKIDEMSCEEVILYITTPSQADAYIRMIKNDHQVVMLNQEYYKSFCGFIESKTWHEGTEDFYRAGLLSDNGFSPILLFVYFKKSISASETKNLSNQIYFLFKKDDKFYFSGDTYCQDIGFDSVQDLIYTHEEENIDLVVGFDIINILDNYPNYLTQDYNLGKMQPVFSYKL